MAVEIEVKVEIADLESLTRSIKRIGGKLLQGEFFEENWVFDFPDHRLKKAGCLLRIRRCGVEYRLTFKQPVSTDQADRHYKMREENETQIDSSAGLIRLFEFLGMTVTFAYQKYRSVYVWRDVELMVDRTPIGNFLELEGDPAEIDHAAEKLGFTRTDYITDTYFSLFTRSGGKGPMIFAK